jgi:hypothetical protein
MNDFLKRYICTGPDAGENFIKLMGIWVGNKGLKGVPLAYNPTDLLVKAVMDKFMKAAGYESVGRGDVWWETSNGEKTVAGWSAVRQDEQKNIRKKEVSFWGLR